MTLTEDLCSKTTITSSISKATQSGWRVWINQIDTDKWWDHSSKRKIRACHKPDDGTFCHLVLLFGNTDNNDNNNTEVEHNHVVHKGALRLGETLEVGSVAILKGNVPPNDQQEYEIALQNTDAVWTTPDHGSGSQQQHLQSLWSFQEGLDVPKTDLKWDQVEDICSWPPLACRWNGQRLQKLYTSLRGSPDHLPVKEKSAASTSNVNNNIDWKNLVHTQSWRQQLEQKMAALVEDESCHRVADQVLSASEDAFEFGRKLALSVLCAPTHCDYLVAGKDGITLNALAFATASSCSNPMDKIQFVSESELSTEGFGIPMGNPMITMRLLPALFRRTSEIGVPLDPVLGSRRIWQEHLALKASIFYLFEGQSKRLWKMALSVVQSALPKTWEALFLEPPDEAFLRALLRPDVLDGGRLRRDLHGNGQQLLPTQFEKMARIYSLARFFRSLPNTVMEKAKNRSVQCSLSSTMKISLSRVKAIANKCRSGTFRATDCLSILDVPDSYSSDADKDSNDQTNTEILGMLALFLHRDRQSYRDTTTGKIPELPPIASCTNQILADCAMYCGGVRWLSVEEQDEEGLWTCLSCLHRWQKRDKREAFQTRKLMHPMKMIKFSRAEYYDPQEWDNIIEATSGQINRLGIDYYWGECSSVGCRKISPAVTRAGACAETDGVPLEDFPEAIALADKTVLDLRSVLESFGQLGANRTVTSSNLEKHFDSEEKLAVLPDPVRRRVRNCIDKSRYILPHGILCESCSIPSDAIDEYCPYCGTGFQPVFACVHYSCPRCHRHFCKACLGIDGIHYQGVYSKTNHVCWRVLGNRYMYHNKGLCAKCGKERPWPKSHSLVSSGPAICSRAIALGEEMPLEEAVALQADNLAIFTSQYEEGAKIFESCSHTAGLGDVYCHCGADVDADGFDGDY